MTAPRYEVGDRVKLTECPSPGAIAAVFKGLVGDYQYRVSWDEFPDDDNLYYERELLPEKENPDG